MKFKSFALLLSLLFAYPVFAAKLSAADVDAIMAEMLPAVSLKMKSKGWIVRDLNKGSVEEAQLGLALDQLKSRNLVVSLRANILPDEDNCNCQDVFKLSMQLAKSRTGNWRPLNETIRLRRTH